MGGIMFGALDPCSKARYRTPRGDVKPAEIGDGQRGEGAVDDCFCVQDASPVLVTPNGISSACLHLLLLSWHLARIDSPWFPVDNKSHNSELPLEHAYDQVRSTNHAPPVPRSHTLRLLAQRKMADRSSRQDAIRRRLTHCEWLNRWHGLCRIRSLEAPRCARLGMLLISHRGRSS